MKSKVIESNYQLYIVIEVAKEILLDAGYDFIFEGQWRPSKVNDLWLRVDAEDPAIPLQRHVHVAHKKHISSKTNQVSWNMDRSRHDLKSFDTKFTGIERAKAVARAALGLADDIVLESTGADDVLALIESIQPKSAPFSKTIINIRARKER